MITWTPSKKKGWDHKQKAELEMMVLWVSDDRDLRTWSFDVRCPAGSLAHNGGFQNEDEVKKACVFAAKSVLLKDLAALYSYTGQTLPPELIPQEG